MLLQRLLRDTRGGAAPLFAAALIPMFGVIGAAVDYSRASSVQAAMQSAADATALALSKNASSLNADQLQANASALFAATFNRPDLQNVGVTASYTTGAASQVAVRATGSVKTWFMGVWPFSVETVDLAAASRTIWGNTRLRVALVLDNTGSMADSNKMTALKTATHNLLNQLKNAAKQPEDVYVSIIPFSKDVNVGPDKYEEDWIDWTIWETKNGTCTKTSYKSKSSCVSNGGIWTPADHNTWNGCVMDRDQNADTTNASPDAGGDFPAEQYASCPVPLLQLSANWTELHAKIDAMTPVGNTNQTIGLAWGWQSLSGGSPLNAPALDPNYQYQQVVILLTDGLNTQNRWSNSESNIDARTQKACSNIKAAGITVYTVLAMAGNPSLLQSCATDATKYFQLTSADQIITTFEAIGTHLTKLRLAK